MKKAIQTNTTSWFVSQTSGIGQRLFAGALVLLLVLSAGMLAPQAQAQPLHPDWKPGDDGPSFHTYNPGTPISKLATFDGRYHYAMIGATESQGESQSTGNCTDIHSQTRTLTIPGGATVEKAYLYWSGSWGNSGADTFVRLNGEGVSAERTFTEFVNGGWNLDFYGAYADVTDLVSGSGNYRVSSLDWKKDGNHCNSNSAYGGWSLVVIYEDASLPESVLHVYDGFDGGEWWPSRSYEVDLHDIDFPDDCSIAAEIGMLIWEGDSYKSEKLYINDGYVGSNKLSGSTDANLDIDLYNISNKVSGSDTKVEVKVYTYENNGGIEWYIHNAFVVKHNKCGADLSCAANKLIDFANVTTGKNASDEPVAGDKVEFTLPITNDGPSTVSGAQVRFYFPDGKFNFDSADTGGGITASSSASGGIETVTFTIGSLASGNTANLTFVLQVDPSATNVGTVVAEVLASPLPDPNSTPDDLAVSFNGSTENIDVVPNPTQDDECTVTFSQLPVELISFGARLDGNSTVLAWATASETNNAGFEVQHSYAADAAKSGTFTVLDFVEGQGTTEAEQAYAFRVDDLEPGRHTFRLKQIDYDGTFEYSPEIEVEVDMADSFVMEAAYPNPFNPEATFRFAVRTQQEIRVELYNMLGQRVQLLYQGNPEPGTMQRVTIDGSGLPSGTYLVRAIGDSFAKTQAVSLVK